MSLHGRSGVQHTVAVVGGPELPGSAPDASCEALQDVSSAHSESIEIPRLVVSPTVAAHGTG